MARGKLNKLTKAERESQRAASILTWGQRSASALDPVSILRNTPTHRYPFEGLFSDVLEQCDHDVSSTSLTKISPLLRELYTNLFRQSLSYLLKGRMQRHQNLVLKETLLYHVFSDGPYSKSLLPACQSTHTRSLIQSGLLSKSEEVIGEAALRRCSADIFDAICDLAKDHGRDIHLWGPPCVCSIVGYNHCFEKLVATSKFPDFSPEPDYDSLLTATEVYEWIKSLPQAGPMFDSLQMATKKKEVTGSAWKTLIKQCWEELIEISTEIIEDYDPLEAPCAKPILSLINDTDPIDLYWAIVLHELQRSDGCPTKRSCWATSARKKAKGCSGNEAHHLPMLDDFADWMADTDRMFAYEEDEDKPIDEVLSELVEKIKKEGDKPTSTGSKSRMANIAARGRRYTARAVNELAETAFFDDRDLSAVERYTWAIGYDPTDAVYPAHRATCLLKMQCWAQAESDCCVALALAAGDAEATAANSPMAYLQRGVVRAHQEKFEGAKSDFEAVLQFEIPSGSRSTNYRDLASQMLSDLKERPHRFKKTSTSGLHSEVSWADAWDALTANTRQSQSSSAAASDKSQSGGGTGKVYPLVTLEDVAPVPLSIFSKVPELRALYTSLITGKPVKIPPATSSKTTTGAGSAATASAVGSGAAASTKSSAAGSGPSSPAASSKASTSTPSTSPSQSAKTSPITAASSSPKFVVETGLQLPASWTKEASAAKSGPSSPSAAKRGATAAPATTKIADGKSSPAATKNAQPPPTTLPSASPKTKAAPAKASPAPAPKPPTAKAKGQKQPTAPAPAPQGAPFSVEWDKDGFFTRLPDDVAAKLNDHFGLAPEGSTLVGKLKVEKDGQVSGDWMINTGASTSSSPTQTTKLPIAPGTSLPADIMSHILAAQAEALANPTSPAHLSSDQLDEVAAKVASFSPPSSPLKGKEREQPVPALDAPQQATQPYAEVRSGGLSYYRMDPIHDHHQQLQRPCFPKVDLSTNEGASASSSLVRPFNGSPQSSSLRIDTTVKPVPTKTPVSHAQPSSSPLDQVAARIDSFDPPTSSKMTAKSAHQPGQTSSPMLSLPDEGVFMATGRAITTEGGYTWALASGATDISSTLTYGHAVIPDTVAEAWGLAGEEHRDALAAKALEQQQLMEQICFAWMFIKLVKARIAWEEHELKQMKMRAEREAAEAQRRAQQMEGSSKGAQTVRQRLQSLQRQRNDRDYQQRVEQRNQQGLQKGFLLKKTGAAQQGGALSKGKQVAV